VIDVSRLVKQFGSLRAVDDVSFAIPAGQICGYLGPNGAGKTTTVKLLTGMLKPDGGAARIAGYDILADPVEVKKRIGLVPESGAVYQSLTPREYLSFVGRLYHLSEDLIESRIAEFLQFFGLESKIDQPMTGFSKGMKQKVVIASALIHQPDVLFLDEPLNGLDANAALLLKELIRNLAHQGKTVFYTSHILEVVENLCDRVIILNNGKIAADGSVNQLKDMTRQSSLEGVFSQLTRETDASEQAAAFSRSFSKTEP
jgi:ABC-2 type transport system ATP-binding protein